MIGRSTLWDMTKANLNSRSEYTSMTRYLSGKVKNAGISFETLCDIVEAHRELILTINETNRALASAIWVELNVYRKTERNELPVFDTMSNKNLLNWVNECPTQVLDEKFRDF